MRTAHKRFEARKNRVRLKIQKSYTTKPRLSIFKSGRHLYAQVLDKSNLVLVSASTLDASIRELNKSNCNVLKAEKLGKLIGSKAKEKGLTEVVFDRSGYKYHGVVKSIADSARNFLDF